MRGATSVSVNLEMQAGSLSFMARPRSQRRPEEGVLKLLHDREEAPEGFYECLDIPLASTDGGGFHDTYGSRVFGRFCVPPCARE